MNETEKGSHAISEAFTLAFITFCGFFFSFLFQYGYFSFFKIPINLMVSLFRVDIVMVSVMIIGISLALSLFFTFVNVLSMMGIFERDTALKRAISSNIPIILFGLTEIALHIDDARRWIPTVAFVIFYTIVEFGVPLLRFRSANTLEEKLKLDEDSEREILQKSIYAKFVVKLGKTPVLFVLYFIFAALIIPDMGEIYARSQKQFMVAHCASLPYVVLAADDDGLWALGISDADKGMTEEIRYVSKVSSDECTGIFTFEELGPLKTSNSLGKIDSREGEK